MAMKVMLMTQKNTEMRAFVTFLAGNGDYVDGVVGLAKGLRKAKSRYPLVVAVLPDVPEEHRWILVLPGCMSLFICPRTKLNLQWLIIYCQLLVTPNMGGTIETPPVSYVYYKIVHCQQKPNNAHWDGEEMGPRTTFYFNASMFLFEPNMCTDHDLLSTLQVTQPTPFAKQIIRYSNDQSRDFLNMYFKDIYKPIPTNCNLVLAMLWRHPENIIPDNNREREDIKMLVKKWWDIDDDESLNYKPEEARAKSLEGAPLETNNVNYILAPSAA
ncbi:hypothetical protein Cgig2_010239 [Carnegiea gigantea]|uniref:Hexosyltransferase n=1 Tax=Carnegiea gigantea TaxID=171969 RepID=A0A9Q1GIT4_9CARY|nr:hypothetical protein Cgig2_010239 [Carnegiea gigantea]